MLMRTCSKCGVEKDLERSFYKHPLHASGYMTACRSCHCAQVRLRRLTNPKVQEYDRERAKRPERRAYAASKQKRLRNPIARWAHVQLQRALKAGEAAKASACELCGANGHLHGHHKDYGKPLEVVWLCARCHTRLHALFPELEAANKKAVTS